MNRLGFSSLSALMYTILALTFLVFQWYGLSKDVDAYIDRAQVAADREDMIDYMQHLKENMQKNDLTEGHFALIFTTPANDLALHFKTVGRILERLHGIEGIPKNETAYQVALDDIRGTIRELKNPSSSVVWVRFWFLYVGFVIWLWPIVEFFIWMA